MNSTALNRGKLVRDRIPEIIEASGGEAVVRMLNPREFENALRKKLVEEVKELSTASGEQIAGEVADVLEVIDAFCALKRVTTSAIRDVRKTKAKERGVFERRVFLIETRRGGEPEQSTSG